MALDEARLLARFVVARDIGDDALRRAAWRRLAIRSYDRIRALVIAHTYDGTARIKEHQRDDVVQEAFLRVIAMGERHTGSSVGEFRNAIRTCVWNTCMDWGRSELARDRRVAGSLDEPHRGDDGDAAPSRFDAAQRAEHAEREADREEKEALERRLARDRDLLADAIARVENEAHRRVLELTFLDKRSGEEIAALLEITMDNVFQRRRRGKRRLEEILRDVAR